MTIAALGAFTLTGCSTAFRQAASYGDDMYEVHDRTEIAARKAAEAKAAEERAQARQAAWESALAQAKADAIANGTY